MKADPQRVQPVSGDQISIEDYFRLDSTHPLLKFEYQNGKLRLMSGGSREHDTIAFNMRTALKQQMQTGPCSVSGSDMRVQVSENSYYFPDVTVSCDVADRRRGNTLIRSPRIVVEVLSPSTEKFDRTDKMQMYQTCPTIHTVALISQFTPHVEIFQRNEQASVRWNRIVYGPGETVVLTSLDIHIPIAEIYQDMDFDEPLLED